MKRTIITIILIFSAFFITAAQTVEPAPVINQYNSAEDDVEALIRQLEEMGDREFFNFLMGLSLDVSQQQRISTKTEFQIIYLPILQEMGFLPSVDEAGDIHFIVNGKNYFIIIDEKDTQFFHIYMGFSLPSAARENALNAANEINRNSKVAKVTISPPQSERLIVSITAELLLSEPEYFEQIFSRAISLIRTAERNFISLLNQE
ncbi:MAG: YbjN domain-containing protein [Treponema sp.]|nr:YbjN domain-containing protein [Treponema sp.]